MIKNLPKKCKVVVIGGGVAGCSVAYHLAKFGWKDTILLERDQLTSGTTWHAAGLVGQLGATATITKLRKYSLNLYRELEKKTGLSTGLKQNGAITVASTKERLQELMKHRFYLVFLLLKNINILKRVLANIERHHIGALLALLKLNEETHQYTIMKTRALKS